MFQADQKQIVQSANMILINIRTAEVQYFSTFFANFGMQAAIVAGAIVGAVSQTPGLDYTCSYVFIFMYFTCSAAALVVSCQVLITTLIASAFGQGYALRGPLGSMVQTIDGMIAEQHQIVFAFVTAIVFFVLQTAAMYMIVMTETLGYICFTINLIGGCVTYSYALRIYNRFHFQSDKVTWQDEGPGSDDPVKTVDAMISDEPGFGKKDNTPSAPHNMNPRNYLRNLGRGGGGGGGSGEIRQRKTLLSKIMPSFSNTNTSNPPPHENYNEFGSTSLDGGTPYFQMNDLPADNKTAGDTNTVISAIHRDNAHAKTSSSRTVVSEGYMTVKSNKTMTIDPWERRYFLLQGTSIFYYKDKRSYELAPSDPINTRPIDLEGFSIVAGASEPPYAITLVPVDAEDGRKSWKFRCDTLAEFSNWIEKFSKALNSSEHQNSTRDQLVVLSSSKTVNND